MEELLQTTLCYLEQDGCYLMLHRVKKKNDVKAAITDSNDKIIEATVASTLFWPTVCKV